MNPCVSTKYLAALEVKRIDSTTLRGPSSRQMTDSSRFPSTLFQRLSVVDFTSMLGARVSIQSDRCNIPAANCACWKKSLYGGRYVGRYLCMEIAMLNIPKTMPCDLTTALTTRCAGGGVTNDPSCILQGAKNYIFIIVGLAFRHRSYHALYVKGQW